MSALAHNFGVRPWEIDLLTLSDFNALCDAAEQLNESQEG